MSTKARIDRCDRHLLLATLADLHRAAALDVTEHREQLLSPTPPGPR